MVSANHLPKFCLRFPKHHLWTSFLPSGYTREIQNTLNSHSENVSSGTPGCQTLGNIYQGCTQQKALVFASLVFRNDTPLRFGAGKCQCQKGTCPGAARAEMLSSAHKGNVALGGTVQRRWRTDRVTGEHLGLLSTIPTPHPTAILPVISHLIDIDL